MFAEGRMNILLKGIEEDQGTKRDKNIEIEKK
jgi:hypothetical protein